MAALGKRKRVSKNKKKNWRKHTDIKDVEKYLDLKRFEERTGGPVSDKTDSALFFVDNLQANQNESLPQEKGKKTFLRCFQNLQPSVWPEPFIKPNRTKTPEERQKNLLARGVKKQKKNKSQPSNNLNESSATKVSSTWNPQFDLWKEEDEPESVLDKDLKNYFLEQTKQKKLKVPELRFKKPSALPAVQVPCPGASYNPTFEDYSKLIAEANSIEEKKVKKEERINRAFPKKVLRSTQEVWLEEMSQGLLEAAAEDSSEEETDMEVPINAPVRAGDRKTRPKRNRELKTKLLLKEIDQQKLKRKLENDVFRLKSLKAEIKAENVKSEETQKKRQEKEKMKLTQPAKISPYPFVAPDLEVLLPEELSGTLREMKPQGSLLEDRIKSFQRRNIIEPRIRQKKYRKYALKKYMKKSHK